MISELSKQTILALAPDNASRSAALEVSHPRKWTNTRSGDQWTCGECAGSGKTPYKIFVHRLKPIHKCSCPSRKAPCKHVVGLLLLHESHPELFSNSTPPDWAVLHLKSAESSNADRSDGRSQTKDTVGNAACRRREERMADGVIELQRWLRDLVRLGLADVQRRGSSYWQTFAARMVDAQMPGAARLVRELSTIDIGDESRRRTALLTIGRLHLMAEAFTRREQLDEAGRADLRAAMGWTIDRLEVLSASEGTMAPWAVIGQRVVEEDGLRAQRTWLCSIDLGQAALYQQYAYGQAPFETQMMPATAVAGLLIYYPGTLQARALFADGPIAAGPLTQLPSVCEIVEFLSKFSLAAARQPWLERAAASLSQVDVLRSGSRWWVRDSGSCLTIDPAYPNTWQLAALTGGRSADICGEWDGEYFWPLSVRTENRVVAL